MVQPDNTPAVTGADVEASVTPATESTWSESPGPGTTESENVGGDAEIVDAELVPAPTTSTTAPVPAPGFDYTDAGVPTLGYLQDKIERRYGNALGGTELAGATPEARSAAEAQEERDKAAADRLEQIRRSLHPDS